MSCKYIYKNKIFDSEIELDDFLLENSKLEPILGDVVYNGNTTQNVVYAKLKKINEDSQELEKKYKSFLQKKDLEYTEDGEPIINEPPYIGVNKYLANYRTSEGNRIIPEFNDENYWKEREADWKSGIFTETEEEVFGIKNGVSITDSNQINMMKNKMQERWKNQAKMGDAIHNALQIFFSKDENNNNVFDRIDIEQYILENIESKNKNFINIDIIKQAINLGIQLKQELVQKFGEDLIFFPEFVISTDTNNITLSNNPIKLLGKIDLLVLDKNGKVHVIDYKTSVHSYDKFAQPKRLSFTYQLSVYSRMLEKYGFNMFESKSIIVPIQIENFKEDGDIYTYDGIKPYHKLLVDITASDNMWNNIDQFLPSTFKVSVTTEKALSNIQKVMSQWFPSYQSQQIIDKEYTIKLLKKRKLLNKNENGIYTFNKFEYKSKPITSDNEIDFVEKVTSYLQEQTPKRLRYTGRIKSIIKEAMEHGIKNVEFPTITVTKESGSVNWLKDTLSMYCDGNWEVVEDSGSDLLEQYGVIMIKTKDGLNLPKQVEFIRISTNSLEDSYRRDDSNSSKVKNHKSLIGTYENDLQAFSKPNSLMLEGVIGNVELIELMLLINYIQGLEGSTVGSLHVINPITGLDITASNEELLYCFNQLNSYYSTEYNKFASNQIKLANKFEQAVLKFHHIMKLGEDNDFKDEYRDFKGFKEVKLEMDKSLNSSNDERLRALLQLKDQLEGIGQDKTNMNKSLEVTYGDQYHLKQKHIDLYNAVILAISSLKGMDFRQQLRDHDLWFGNILRSLEVGISGNMTDNPGNLQSQTLNQITMRVQEAQQNVRDEMQIKNNKLQKLVYKLKNSKNYGYLKENTLGNQVSLYDNMFFEDSNGDLLFKNPNDLSDPVEKEFLEFVLNEINKDRFPNKSEEVLKVMKESNNPEYYRVPLCLGGMDNISNDKGLFSLLKAKLKYLRPKTAWEMSKRKLEGIFSEDDEKTEHNSQLLYKMVNMFDKGNDVEKRINKIRELKEKNIPIEKNIETILLRHMFAYSMQRNIDEVFPLIKASMIHLQMQGANINTSFEHDKQYIVKYIKNKIFNETIVSKTDEGWVRKASHLKSAASLFTLAFAPVQALYQPLQGLWQDISLMIRKPDGEETFTFSHFKTALKLAYSELSHFSEKPTVLSSINEVYAINDMDINQYVDRISNAKKGIWNFENLMYKFASRPDFYNRMSIFLCYMLKDGCYKAHKINSKGELEYDWKEDDRFKQFALGNTHHKDYNKQKSLYYAIAKQFVNEGVRYSDGTLFELNMTHPKPLPRAYTNQQAESIKSLSDDIYGYYSHEKKSLIMATSIGSLWLQFKTYWSGKKNQYLAHGGVKLRGKWDHVVQNNEKYYYQIDEQGNILYNEKPLSESEMKTKNMPLYAPVLQWKGQWQEGILITLADIAKQAFEHKSLYKAWNNKWNNEDPGLRTAYRSNIKQAIYDFFMFAVVGTIIGALLGDWLDELKEDNKKNKDFTTGLYIAAANIAVMSIKNSFIDFNFIESIGSPVGQWTPFSFEWGHRIIKTWWEVAMGEEDFWDGVVKSSGSLKQIKPILDSLKPDMFRTKREGGTFGNS